ncbi:MAG: PH domain-containing protein [Alphaproteobacteria bacterium]
MIRKIKSLLVEDEQVVRDARVHWVVFGAPVLYALIGVAVWVSFQPLVGGVILLMTLYPVYTASIHYTMTHLVLTDKKVLVRVGFLTRDWVQMAFDKVENAYLEEPIVGRYLGYSTVVVSGIGAGAIAVPYVADGDVFIKELEGYLDKNREDWSTGAHVVVEGEDLLDSLEKKIRDKEVA